MINLSVTLAVLAVVALLSFKKASLIVWTVSYLFLAALATKFSALSTLSLSAMWLGLGIFALLNSKKLRQKVISHHLFSIYKKYMPAMSSTEREALEAGTVSWEGDIFTGNPDFNKLKELPTVTLNEEEQAFIDGPVTELCRMIDDWDITHNRTDLPQEVWHYIKENKFLGMIIPKSYGGLELSASAQVAILTKLYGRSVSVATTVSVPNSLGPGELLLKYGTQEQKDYYLPRLAKGQEIPCFALTGPNAGSDAASLPDKGIVCKQIFNGKETLGIRLNWDKRYITLCPVATLIGLAFKLFDPEGLLGSETDLGITCALIPSDTPGVVKGRRHFPLNTAFMNGPTQGKDVFIPMDYIIGGQEMVGKGWRMLMECLSAGRAISLPSSAVGGAQAAALATGAYARVRKQFNTAIGNFEGIEEALTRIAANTYICDSGLSMAAAAIDHGAKPAVASAILKYHTTERARTVANDAMDVHGGKGICLGPNNYIGRGYQSSPIGITVEGANILTRSLIIFGQGAIRCHPYVFEELEAALANDLSRFDKAFFAHIGMVLNNAVKSLVLGISHGYLASLPNKKMWRYYQLLSRYSANFSFMADYSMAIVGANLKRKEKLSARLGDILSLIYLCSAVLKRYHDEGYPEQDKPLIDWCCQHLLSEIEEKMTQVIQNFPSRSAAFGLRLLIMPWGKRMKAPNDALGAKVAKLMLKPTETRRRLSRFVFSESLDNCPLGQVEEAFNLIHEAYPIEQKIAVSVKKGQVSGLTLLEQIDDAESSAIITTEEAEQMRLAENARQKVIAVDDFAHEELARATDSVSKLNKKNEVLAD